MSGRPRDARERGAHESSNRFESYPSNWPSIRRWLINRLIYRLIVTTQAIEWFGDESLEETTEQTEITELTEGFPFFCSVCSVISVCSVVSNPFHRRPIPGAEPLRLIFTGSSTRCSGTRLSSAARCASGSRSSRPSPVPSHRRPPPKPSGGRSARASARCRARRCGVGSNH